MKKINQRAAYAAIICLATMGCMAPRTETSQVADPFLLAQPASHSVVRSSGSQPRETFQQKGPAELPVATLPPREPASPMVDAPADLPIIQPVSFEVEAAPVRAAPSQPLPTSGQTEVERTLQAPAGEVVRPAATMPLSQPSTPGPVPKLVESGALQTSVAGKQLYPIDLANALALGGADHLDVRLARTRLFQAQARYLEAKTLWLPSLRFGIGYSKHDGRLQQTEGDVLQINRNSTFVGGGLGLADTPLVGGTGGPPRLFVALSTADAVFAPLAACQVVAAHGAAERAAANDAQTEIALAYFTLVEAQGALANARFEALLTARLVDQVGQFAREGYSSETESRRARTAASRTELGVVEARRQVNAARADLARVLRLPPAVDLMPVEDVPLPIELVEAVEAVDGLIAQALGRRPELAQLAALREAACWRVKHELWRPWSPHVQVGASGGEFGGAPGSAYRNGGSRSDVELLAVWEWQNLGLGNVALQRQRRGELHERGLELEQLRDQIAAEVVEAAGDVESYREQIDISLTAIADAQESYRMNDFRIREGEGLPIELLQSIAALAAAQDDYNLAVANYNRAQYRLLRAIGY